MNCCRTRLQAFLFTTALALITLVTLYFARMVLSQTKQELNQNMQISAPESL